MISPDCWYCNGKFSILHTLARGSADPPELSLVLGAWPQWVGIIRSIATSEWRPSIHSCYRRLGFAGTPYRYPLLARFNGMTVYTVGSPSPFFEACMYITSWWKALFGPTEVFDLDPILNLVLTGSRSRLRTPCNTPSLIIVVDRAHFF